MNLPESIAYIGRIDSMESLLAQAITYNDKGKLLELRLLIPTLHNSFLRATWYRRLADAYRQIEES